MASRWITVLLAILAFSTLSAQQPVIHSATCPSSRGQTAPVLHPGARAAALSLCDGYALDGDAASSAGTPLALATADFDGDGVPDLVSTFNDGNGGTITIHRGNIDALWPYGAALRNGPPPAFLQNPWKISVPESPDFVVTGDFDADGHQDILVAQRGSMAMYFLRGDGKSCRSPQVGSQPSHAGDRADRHAADIGGPVRRNFRDWD